MFSYNILERSIDMNYYNPYMMMMPYTSAVTAPAKTGLFSGLLSGARGINWGSLLNNTQRTLGLINQAIPVVKQVTPVMRNARTMFRVMNEFKRVDEPATNQNIQNTPTNQNQNQAQSTADYTPQLIQDHQNAPTFFV